MGPTCSIAKRVGSLAGMGTQYVCANLIVRWELRVHDLGRASIDWGEEESARIVRGNTRVRRGVSTVVLVYVCYVASSSS